MLIGFSVGMPAFAVFLYCVRAFHARRNTRSPFYLNLFENALNVALVIPLVALIGQTGLSLAYSLAYCAAAVAAIILLNRHVHGLLNFSTLRMLMRSLLVSACVIAAMAGTVLLVRPKLGDFGELLAGLTVAIAVFVIATLVFRPYGFDPLLNKLRRRSSRPSASG
jgi:putative peptidoglycan lipid II flippase